MMRTWVCDFELKGGAMAYQIGHYDEHGEYHFGKTVYDAEEARAWLVALNLAQGVTVEELERVGLV